jgi:hypothetical protein
VYDVFWCDSFGRKNLEEVNNRLDEWRLTLVGKGLRISRNKTEYIEYEFRWRYQEVEDMKRSMAISGDIYYMVKLRTLHIKDNL